MPGSHCDELTFILAQNKTSLTMRWSVDTAPLVVLNFKLQLVKNKYLIRQVPLNGKDIIQEKSGTPTHIMTHNATLGKLERGGGNSMD